MNLENAPTSMAAFGEARSHPDLRSQAPRKSAMRPIVVLICLSLSACAPWLIDKPEQVAESRVAVCKKTGSRITRPCESSGSITQDQWDDVRSTVSKPASGTISERRGRKR